MRMKKIKTIHVQSFINSLTKPGVNKVDPEKGLSRKTIKHYLSFVSSIFDYASIALNPIIMQTLRLMLEAHQPQCYFL